MSKTIDLLEIYTDGGSRGNPGPAAIGVVALAHGQKIFSLSEKIGLTTNNVAEYTAVLRALKTIEDQEIYSAKLRFTLDSELIVKQIIGLYRVKQPHLQLLKKEVVDQIKKLQHQGQIKLISFVTVLREKNKNADLLVNQALDS